MLNSIVPESVNGGVGTVTLPTLMICLLVAVILGVLTSLVFSFKTKHSQSFSLTLALLPMAICIVIILVNGSIGMGVAVSVAFTLVRFRSIPGTAREISAFFTTMVIGLALGTGYVGIAVVFFVLTSLLTIILTVSGFGGSAIEKQLKITIPENLDYNGLFDDLFDEYKIKTQLTRVRTINLGTLFELTYDVRFPSNESPKAFIDAVRTRNGNLNVIVCNVSGPETL